MGTQNQREVSPVDRSHQGQRRASPVRPVPVVRRLGALRPRRKSYFESAPTYQTDPQTSFQAWPLPAGTSLPALAEYALLTAVSGPSNLGATLAQFAGPTPSPPHSPRPAAKWAASNPWPSTRYRHTALPSAGSLWPGLAPSCPPDSR